jgi:hypothetical protein
MTSRDRKTLTGRFGNLYIKPLSSIIVVLLVALLASATNQPARIRVSELDRTPLTAGPLRITLTKFRGSFLKVGGGSIEAQVENTSAEFSVFSPQRLSFVGSDNSQADILAIQSGDRYWCALDRRIAPGARTKEFYALNGKVRLPARVYYDEKLLAEIVD